MTRPTVDQDQAAGLVSHFYRDLDDYNTKDMRTLLSDNFKRDHQADWFRAYGWMQDAKIQINGVRDRTVSYTLDYDYATTTGKLFWERTGIWTLDHGASAGWVLDKDIWSSVHLLGFSTSTSGPMIPVQDTVYSDGRHRYTMNGQTYEFSANDKTWQIAAIGPPPDANAQTQPTESDSQSATPQPYQPTVTVTQNGTTKTYTGSVKIVITPPPGSVFAGTSGPSCESVSLQWKSDDGDWIGTDDGRKFHVMPGDESEVTTWAASDDLRICGDTIFNIDDRSHVEIY